MGDRKQLMSNVRSLRRKGLTYSEITRRLGVNLPKSTLSDWCRDVAMPTWYEQKIVALNLVSFKKAQRMALISMRLKQEGVFNDIIQRNKHLSRKLIDKDVAKMLLAMLYLGEGSKRRSHSGLMLGSSDPDIVLLYIKLLQKCYGIGADKLQCMVSYRADQNLLGLQRYWSKITKISLSKFYNTKCDPRTVGRATKRRDYKGVCVVMCAGANIQLELELISKIILRGL